MDLFVIFITGLTVGGLTCLAVQGGLLASIIALRTQEAQGFRTSHTLFAIGSFLVSRLISHIFLGFVLGTFGEAINIGGNVQVFMQLAAGVYMIAVACNLVEIHPLFRYVILQPPRFLTRMVRNQSRSKDLFAPALLGIMTVFIPCGTTLAMEALAVASASGIVGASILGVFILGTVPSFLGIGLITSLFGEAFRLRFLKIAAIGIMYLGGMSINGSLVALGSPITARSLLEASPLTIIFPQLRPQHIIGGSSKQYHEIIIQPNGYSPSYIRVKQGEEVVVKLTSMDTYSCALAFRIPSLGISKNLKPNDSQIIAFTPKEKGKIAFTCSMGMHSGIIEVI
jgi:sulfite exporter TauE/SafE